VYSFSQGQEHKY